MKIRTSFVSNSSSSSFIVTTKPSLFAFDKEKEKEKEIKKSITTEEDIKKLREYGFKDCSLDSPYQSNFNNNWEEKEEPNEKDPWRKCSLFYKVSCNQDEVIEFLLRNNIPFKASCHYDNYFISYERDSEHMLQSRNFGIEIDMYGIELCDLMESTKVEPIEKIFIKKYLKQQDKLKKEYRKLRQEEKENED